MASETARDIVPKRPFFLRSAARDIAFVCFLLLIAYDVATARRLGILTGFVGVYLADLGYRSDSRELKILGWALAAAGAFLVTLNLLSLA